MGEKDPSMLKPNKYGVSHKVISLDNEPLKVSVHILIS
jgi:hypothetical protein